MKRIFITVFSLLILIELFSLSYLDSEYQQPFFLNSNFKKVEKNNFIFDEVDPLLGWSYSEEEYKKTNTPTINNSVLLEFKEGITEKKLDILITGGSTSDMLLNKLNWPHYFHEILKEKKINHRLIVAAVGGYSSGQEVLKILRDYLPQRPTIHISYNGANECFNSSYVSLFEQNIFSNLLNESSFFLPNTVFLLRRKIFNQPSLKPESIEHPSDYWIKNLKVMQSISNAFDYYFISFLQPVNGINGRKDAKIDNYKEHFECYETFYALAKKEVNNNHSVNIKDLSAIFQNIKEEVFVDDCHIKDQYQEIIAQEIYNQIKTAL